MNRVTGKAGSILGVAVAWLTGLMMQGCSGPVAQGAPTATVSPPASSASPIPPSPAPNTPIPIATVLPTAAPTITPTPDAYHAISVEGLRERQFGGGTLEIYRRWQANAAFERAYFEYDSDAVQVHGFMNIPSLAGQHPVVLVLHGYINPAEYTMQAYTTRYADALAQAGYFVLHPNYRGYPPSQVGPNPFRAGYAVDVLNLLAIIRSQAGEPGPFERADGERIGLFGHSMGGGIAIRTMVVDEGVRAVVLYGSMSADEQRNFERILEWSGGRAGWDELNAPQSALDRISPINYLHMVEAAVSIHHGEEDQVVPIGWSQELCRLLAALGKQAECFTYPEQPHTFQGDSEGLLIDRALEFFDNQLRAD